MTRIPTPDLAAALAAMKRSSGRGRGRKGPIYQWMAARHDALATAFVHDPPAWTALAKFFADTGLMTADGLPPTPASVRAIWLRVTAQVARQRAIAGKSSLPPLGQPPAVAGMQAISPSPALDGDGGGDGDGGENAFDFGKPVE